MPFRTRNPYYLRISEKNVLPLYLYLDERHLDWMSDLVLQHVLSDLRPHILPKLQAEVNGHMGQVSSKKLTVDTHRGETYQFCYFLRKTEPHSVIVKTRNFVAVPPQKQAVMAPPPISASSTSRRIKRKAESTKAKKSNEKAPKKRKIKGKGRQDQDDIFVSSSDEGSILDHDVSQRTRSSTRKKSTRKNYQENDDNDSSPQDSATVQTMGTTGISIAPHVELPQGIKNPSMMDIDTPREQGPPIPPPSVLGIEEEIEEEKPKPMLQLRYQGYSIYGHCLCVVVEPWPPFRSTSRASSIVQDLPRAPSIAPPEFVPTATRAKTPLFLPDDIDRERSETPAPFRGRAALSSRPSLDHPSFFDDSDDSGDDGGMMEFSQLLSATGEFRAGAADDDEDMDTAIFFGDADERRDE